MSLVMFNAHHVDRESLSFVSLLQSFSKFGVQFMFSTKLLRTEPTTAERSEPEARSARAEAPGPGLCVPRARGARTMSWSFELEKIFRPDDPAARRSVEAAYRRGAKEANVMVGGQHHTVRFFKAYDYETSRTIEEAYQRGAKSVSVCVPPPRGSTDEHDHGSQPACVRPAPLPWLHDSAAHSCSCASLGSPPPHLAGLSAEGSTTYYSTR